MSDVKRYDPAEVLTDRWEMGSMDASEDGDYVRYEDYDTLRTANQRLEGENRRLREALKDIVDDYSDRFDMESPSTNPGMKFVVEQARAALAGTGEEQ